MKSDQCKPMTLSKKTAYYICTFFLSLILTGIQAVNASDPMYIGRSGYRLSDDLQMTYANIVTPTRCGAKCLTFNCSAFTFNKVTKECKVYFKTFQSPVGVTSVPVSEYYKSTVAKSRCEDINPMSGNGVYRVFPIASQSRLYYCYRGADNKFWNVIQYRYDGSLDFSRTWSDYKNGFGTVTQEFWLGNDEIHRLTVEGDTMIRIEMEDYSNSKMYAQYNIFYVDNEQNKYKLTIGSYKGTAGDWFMYHNGMDFTTKDRDNDNYEKNCAQLYFSGYWYNRCFKNNLNGLHQISTPSMSWYVDNPVKVSRMMVRKK